MSSNANADVAEYEGKQKDLERIFNPIASKLYGQGQTGAGPAGPGGCGNNAYSGQAGQAGNSGPQVDEVD
jgi:L1 cell adhesion molecule like protein